MTIIRARVYCLRRDAIVRPWRTTDGCAITCLNSSSNSWRLSNLRRYTTRGDAGTWTERRRSVSCEYNTGRDEARSGKKKQERSRAPRNPVDSETRIIFQSNRGPSFPRLPRATLPYKKHCWPVIILDTERQDARGIPENWCDRRCARFPDDEFNFLPFV